jgi:hypothetical protein
MSVESQTVYSTSNRLESSGRRTKGIVITQELVMALADRIYAALIHEMKIERERNRFPNETQWRRRGR